MRRMRIISSNYALFRIALVLLFAAATAGLWTGPDALTQQPKKEELTAGLQFFPTDAALFAYVDAEKIWANSILQSIRKADGKDFDNFLSVISAETGLSPEDLKSVV